MKSAEILCALREIEVGIAGIKKKISRACHLDLESRTTNSNIFHSKRKSRKSPRKAQKACIVMSYVHQRVAHKKVFSYFRYFPRYPRKIRATFHIRYAVNRRIKNRKMIFLMTT